ncbi:MAG: type VI secretion system ATPase TssH, partial [Chthoniobacteraceae bacterium]
MAEIRRATLFGKLNRFAYKSIEGATVFCKMRGNPYVELVHWLNQILQTPDSDFHRILRHASVDASRVAADLTAALDKLPRGATSVSDFSPHIEEAVERAWVYASLLYSETSIRTGHVILGLVKTPGLRNVFTGISKEFAKIKGEELADELPNIIGGSAEDNQSAQDGSSATAEGGAPAPAAMGKQEALAKFAVDLTAKARAG